VSTVLVELTEEERDAVVHVLGYGMYQARLDKVALPMETREAVQKLRDAEPTEKERVR
jgi:hypothetical protein